MQHTLGGRKFNNHDEASPLDNPTFSLKDTGRPRVVFDISPVMENLKKIFLEFQPEECLPNEPLERMSHALLRHRRSQLAEPDLKVIGSLSFVQAMTFWETQIYAIGEWLMHCQEFAQLPLEEKMKLFKASWVIWQRFERITMSIELFGWRAVNEKVNPFSSS
ncbi:hypothetical protein Y032_1061g3516 [Ancylostoma ceylanicum]|uniref:NR LBD domain-containing protein n=1 Tax=Ancylostoma ceylanicum TaxID=53326 RepID=A0A016W741_9BILA|nr:hypothetical protein Y032_1061g3516 [Ancylostoma ceylanicum]